MQGKQIRISVELADRPGRMCHQSGCSGFTPDAMAVDRPLCASPAGFPIVLPILPGKIPAVSPAVSRMDSNNDELSDLHRLPTAAEVAQEMKQLGKIVGPMVLTGLLMYFRTMVSMLFLGHLGDMQLSGGSLSIGFQNITCYSVLSGLAAGMEPFCAQAFGAGEKKWRLLGLTLQRMILILAVACIPIGAIWWHMVPLLETCGQKPEIINYAYNFMLYSIPDIFAQVLLQPLRIYLRTQNITAPLTACSLVALIVHIPMNFFLVHYLGMDYRGVALAGSFMDINVVLLLLAYLWYSGCYKNTWDGWSLEAFKEWCALLKLSVPSAISVCLEWWWYEFMILMSGLLINPQATVSSMGLLIQVTAFIYIFPSSLSLAVSTRVGNELGANRPAKARIAMLVAMGCAGVMAILAATFTTSMRHIWATMYSKDSAVLAIVAMAMPIVGLCELGNCPQTTGCGVLRGSARPTIAAHINMGSFYLVGLPVALVLAFWAKIGFAGLWLGLLAAQATCATLMCTILLKTDWNKQAQLAKELIQLGLIAFAETKQSEELDEVGGSLIVKVMDDNREEQDNTKYREEDQEKQSLIIKVMPPTEGD